MSDVILVAQASTSASPADAVQAGVVVPASSAASASTEASQAPPFPPFDASTYPSQFVWFVIIFAVLYVVMSRVAVPQLSGIIEKRRARIDGDLKEAERLKGETDKAIAAYEDALATARRNAQTIAEDTRASIRADLEGKRKAVEDDLGHKMADAEARIQLTKTEALGRVGEIASETAAAVVRQLAGEASAGEVSDAVAQVMKG